MELKRRVLTFTVIGSGALSVWGSFYITPYYGKLPKMSNKELFTDSDCKGGGRGWFVMLVINIVSISMKVKKILNVFNDKKIRKINFKLYC